MIFIYLSLELIALRGGNPNRVLTFYTIYRYFKFGQEAYVWILQYVRNAFTTTVARNEFFIQISDNHQKSDHPFPPILF